MVSSAIFFVSSGVSKKHPNGAIAAIAVISRVSVLSRFFVTIFGLAFLFQNSHHAKKTNQNAFLAISYIASIINTEPSSEGADFDGDGRLPYDVCNFFPPSGEFKIFPLLDSSGLGGDGRLDGTALLDDEFMIIFSKINTVILFHTNFLPKSVLAWVTSSLYL